MIGLFMLLLIIGIMLVLISMPIEEPGCAIIGLIFIIISLLCYNSIIIDEIKSEIKLDLPEEIYLAKPGDTLYVTERTKDSIYLGFKYFKE